MNKKFMIGGCAAVAIAGNVFAADEDYSYFNPYASLKGGYAFLGKRNDIKYKGGFAGAVELGVSYDNWRLGLELGYKQNKIKEPEGGYKALGKADVTDAQCIARNDLDANNSGKAAYNHIIDNDLSLFVLDRTGGTNDRGLPIFGITAAQMTAATTPGGAAQYDAIMALRKVSYFELQKLTALTGMINVFYDYAMTDAWSLYAGVGLGVARVNYTAKTGASDPDKATILKGRGGAAGNVAFPVGLITAEVLQKGYETLLPADELHKTEYSKTVFAWQLMAGVGYEFNENWKLTLGYKLFNTAKVKQTFAGKEYKIKMPFNHTAEVGLTYTF